MFFIEFLIIATLIAKVASLIIGLGYGFSWPVSFVGGILGAWLGTLVLGHFGPQWVSFNWIPATIGVVIVMLIFKIIDRKVFG
ncbi:GlsB/YeaQ/YmgE family stress response membrane protein [Weissella confusa]|uniref:GlsB/YeaQ/YmgE family stress response membrane protein n=1 Tax=Weissella confusa TaxID=1583 RepID=A0A4Z0RIR6_WEICO|nr:GlsB/YeaQ/YmgE family stress response membrane protein [Weissella confusa]MBJ7632521.1 GlsB/YeaQ/YmgE family stress response membrane protein [Weissella confusa]MBJ7638657.1 GlsB/YeaQ/YmgE family stress response membrane protein [Weissella confusa]MBJ7645526.1 GlsB/YeaQ/YmgE family stress response membrane protein [Weissella confusa]TGE52625.1 GlsB/YeaQ/YmgE family stress response membrane protein [Weissella confusa]